MRRLFGAALPVACVAALVASCPRAPRTKGVGAAEAPAPGRSTLTVTQGTSVLRFPFGTAAVSGTILSIELTDRPNGCGPAYREPRADEPVVFFAVPPGPRGAFSLGGEIGSEVLVRAPQASFVPPWATRIEIVGLELRVGGRVRGTVRFELDGRRGDGAFDLRLCGVEVEPSRLLAEPPDEPASAVIAGRKASLPRALAFAREDARSGVRYLDRIELYEGMDASCERLLEATLTLRGFGGASSRFGSLLGTWPALASTPTRLFEVPDERALAFVRITAGTLERGSLLRGVFAARTFKSAPHHTAHAAGAFEAVLCAVEKHERRR